jgi:hypothetical protein
MPNTDTRSTRVQTRLPEEARHRSAIVAETDPVTAGPLPQAARGRFGIWLAAQRGTLTGDFDIGLS